MLTPAEKAIIRTDNRLKQIASFRAPSGYGLAGSRDYGYGCAGLTNVKMRANPSTVRVMAARRLENQVK
jgi:hypothetical protein